MTRKRTRTSPPNTSKGKQPATSATHHDDNTFSVEGAEDRYNRRRNKNALPERGFDVHANAHQVINKRIHRLGWTRFCTHPAEANLSIVREFYANHQLPEHRTSIVRGVTVSWGARVIHDFYALPDQGFTYQSNTWTYIRDQTDYEAVAARLCNGQPQWVKYGNDEHASLSIKSIDWEAKAWLYFVCARLIPTSTMSNVSLERCKLVYHILEGTDLHIGDLISAQIIKCATDYSKGFYFPTLITELCKQAGVQAKPTDVVLKPKGVIDDKTIRQYGHAEEPIADPPVIKTTLTKRDLLQTVQQVERGLVMCRNDIADVRHEMTMMKATVAWIGKMVTTIGNHLRCDFSDCVEPTTIPRPAHEAVPAPMADEEANSSGNDELD